MTADDGWCRLDSDSKLILIFSFFDYILHNCLSFYNIDIFYVATLIGLLVGSPLQVVGMDPYLGREWLGSGGPSIS